MTGLCRHARRKALLAGETEFSGPLERRAYMRRDVRIGMRRKAILVRRPMRRSGETRRSPQELGALDRIFDTFDGPK